MEGCARLEGGDLLAAAAVLGQAVAKGRATGSLVIAAHASYWLAVTQLALGQRHEAAAITATMDLLTAAGAAHGG